MFYRESGQFKTSYSEDMVIFPLVQDRWAVTAMAVAAALVPLFLPAVVGAASADRWFAILIQILYLSAAALGLNILAGYAGLISLGHAGFMAVGAYTAYNLSARLDLPILVSFFGGGLMAALVGLIFGLPSLRIKGFYLLVSTLAAQFTIEWVINHVPWISGDNVLGAIDTPPMIILGMNIDTPGRKYLLSLFVVLVLALFAKNLVRSEVGRSWMAVRDRDIAAEIIGISLFRVKILAFAVSSFYAGVAGALVAFCYLGSVQITEFELVVSFQILGMIIIGGLGSILGSFLGAAFFALLPIFINEYLPIFIPNVRSDLKASLELVAFGGLIIFFLIV
ncbi:MAG: branched-chain amino acid ABC transporter permease, partial [bacterium]